MPLSTLVLDYGERYPHELFLPIRKEIERLIEENQALQSAIDAGKPARRRQPTIERNKRIIDALTELS